MINIEQTFSELQNIIIKYGHKDKVGRGIVSRLKYIDDYYFEYNSLTGNISLNKDEEVFNNIGKKIGLLVDLSVSDDVLSFYTQVIKMNLDLPYNFGNLLDLKE